MKTLKFTVSRSGFITIPVKMLKGMDNVSANYMWIYSDTRDGVFISSKNPIIEWNNLRLKVRFKPKYEYIKKNFLKRHNEIVKYPDVEVQVKPTENELHIFYWSNIKDTKIEGKFIVPTTRPNEVLTIKNENLPYSVTITVNYRRLSTG